MDQAHDSIGTIGTTTTADEPSRTEQLTGAARSAAGDATSTAGEQAQRVKGEAATQVRSVVDTTKQQVGDLVQQAGSGLREQADARGSQAAGGLRNVAGQLQALCEGRPGDAGALGGYLDEARHRVSGIATRLDEGGIDGVLSDVSDFARRRPGMFLALAAGAGFLAGRLVRSGISVSGDDGGTSGRDDTDALLGRSDPLGAGGLDTGAPSTWSGSTLPPPADVPAGLGTTGTASPADVPRDLPLAPDVRP